MPVELTDSFVPVVNQMQKYIRIQSACHRTRLSVWVGAEEATVEVYWRVRTRPVSVRRKIAKRASYRFRMVYYFAAKDKKGRPG
jgi:hypothetical protein